MQIGRVHFMDSRMVAHWMHWTAGIRINCVIELRSLLWMERHSTRAIEHTREEETQQRTVCGLVCVCLLGGDAEYELSVTVAIGSMQSRCDDDDDYASV